MRWQVVYDALRNVAGGWTRRGWISGSDAEDLVHRTMLGLLEAGREAALEPAYAVTALWNERRTVFRERQAKKRGGDVEHVEWSTVAWGTLVASDDPDPEKTLLDKEQITEVAECVRALPDRQRTVVQLYRQGLSSEEIAKIMGTSGHAVRALLRRALLALGRTASKKRGGSNE